MATEKNITMKQYNGTDYDTLYPRTLSKQVDVSANLLNDFGLTTGGLDDIFGVINNNSKMFAIKTEAIITSGTWTAPANLTGIVKVYAFGGGGAGGSNVASTTATHGGPGGGGGGGHMSIKKLSIAPGAKIPVVIGAGGTGVLGADGGTGGTTTFGTVSAAGGSGGKHGDTNPWTDTGGDDSSTVYGETGGAGGDGGTGGGGGSGHATGGSQGDSGGNGGNGSYGGGGGAGCVGTSAGIGGNGGPYGGGGAGSINGTSGQYAGQDYYGYDIYDMIVLGLDYATRKTAAGNKAGYGSQGGNDASTGSSGNYKGKGGGGGILASGGGTTNSNTSYSISGGGGGGFGKGDGHVNTVPNSEAGGAGGGGGGGVILDWLEYEYAYGGSGRRGTNHYSTGWKGTPDAGSDGGQGIVILAYMIAVDPLANF